jgi:hypothetical protein
VSTVEMTRCVRAWTRAALLSCTASADAFPRRPPAPCAPQRRLLHGLVRALCASAWRLGACVSPLLSHSPPCATAPAGHPRGDAQGRGAHARVHERHHAEQAPV